MGERDALLHHVYAIRGRVVFHRAGEGLIDSAQGPGILRRTENAGRYGRAQKTGMVKQQHRSLYGIRGRKAYSRLLRGGWPTVCEVR